MKNKHTAEMPAQTTHKIYYKNSKKMDFIKDKSIDLIVTSPPYPMIQMWDEIFASQNKNIKSALSSKDGRKAFESMHQELDKIWSEAHRVLKDGGIACINIGDATRTIEGNFVLYPNHSRVINYFYGLGFDLLPSIIWRKQTNAPNKFMGSGMLPVGAYVTLEHEYILIFRKKSKRLFNADAHKKIRQESSFFWEERNTWFSDVWMNTKGVGQKILDKKTRDRSAAYPFEIAHRLINMYSVKGDTVLDPFLGTGTTSVAAVASERNSIGVEIDATLKKTIESFLESAVEYANEIIDKRIEKHEIFLEERASQKKETKYKNHKHGFSVMTKPEKEIILKKLISFKKKGDEYSFEYEV